MIKLKKVSVIMNPVSVAISAPVPVPVPVPVPIIIKRSNWSAPKHGKFIRSIQTSPNAASLTKFG
jgi:hypothetical protein